MTTDYNQIAAEYKQAKLQPWRFYIERYTMFQLIGDLQGKAVLDLACGEGYYTRALKQKGAARVVGVDLSEGMIELARKEEMRLPLGIEYRVGNATEVVEPASFDLVVAAYLLNYAQTPEQLLAMCQSCARSLKPGGRFVGVNNNPEHARAYFGLSKPYGFVKSAPEDLRDGTPVVYTIFLDTGHIDLTNYHQSTATHAWAFRTAGFHELHWHAPRVSPEGSAHLGDSFWKDFLDHPPVIFIEARKS